MAETNVKEPKTIEEQVEILKSRNMKIDDEEEVIRILGTTNYYRITAYALQFKENDDYGNKVSFSEVYNLYIFDKKMRHLILGILESIEISMRTSLAYNLAIEHGAEAHELPDIFNDKDKYHGYTDSEGNEHKGLIQEIKIEKSKNRKELFVKHHISKYKGCFPIWVIVEIFSFGMLSRTYSNLNTKDQKKISKSSFGVNYQLLESWLKNLAYIRNLCAHYGRIYNKKMSTQPKLHNRYQEYTIEGNRVFASILAIKELIKGNSEWLNFKVQLEALIEEYKEVIDLKLIGFPENWIEILEK